MQLLLAVERPQSLLDALFDAWKASVRATHHFLSEEDIYALQPLVREALAGIDTLAYAVDADGKALGFLGVSERKIEMLFLAPDSRGKGLGRRFVEYAENVLGATCVDVNEQNTQGVGFYTHLGFVVFDRSERDGQGNPFPLLHLKKGESPEMPAGYAVFPAEPEHLPLLAGIELAAATLFPPGSIPESVRAERVPLEVLREGRESGGLFVGLDMEGVPVGYALLHSIEGFALLAQLDVKPEHGRKGLGRALVWRVVRKARSMGFDALYLTTFSDVPWNAPFYVQLGFAVLAPEEEPPFLRDILAEERGRELKNRVGMRLELAP